MQLNDSLQSANRRLDELFEKCRLYEENSIDSDLRLKSTEQECKRKSEILDGLKCALHQARILDDQNLSLDEEMLENCLRNLISTLQNSNQEKVGYVYCWCKEKLAENLRSLRRQLDFLEREKKSADLERRTLHSKLEQYDNGKMKLLETRQQSMQKLLQTQGETLRNKENEKSRIDMQINQLNLQLESREKYLQ
uniref:Uncharacterized protein n=1 Tax=Romanomermis culicivorax TaxID=13658 RepID=A0A915HZJ9_ROMCU